MKEALRLIQMLHTIEADREITPENFKTKVPEDYGNFLRDLHSFVNPWPGSGTFRCAPFDNAGYPVFRANAGCELYMKTRKGLMLICRAR